MTRKQRRAAAAPAFTPELAFAEGLTPDDFAEFQAMYARVHGSSVGETPASPEPAPPACERADEPAVLRLPKAQEVLAQGTACTEGALEAPVLQHLSAAKTQVDEPAVLSAAKTQERPGPTGPRTPEGKAISSANSLKHGLASGRLIIPGEDRDDFGALLNDLVAEHAPATPTEEMLVQQMAQSWWLMHRALRIQNQAFMETWCDMKKLALFLRYQTTYERAFYRALNSLKKLQKERLAAPRVGATHAAPEFVSHNHLNQAPEPTRGVGFQPATPAFRPALTDFVSQTSAAPTFIAPMPTV